jgi:hypothetical protein
MSLPFDPSRRHSLGGPGGSPQQYPPGAFPRSRDAAINGADHRYPGPLEPPHAPPSFASRNMPPPSPPQPGNSSSTSSILGSAPRGPPTSSPFSGIRDLASLSSVTAPHRPSGGMSISSILGGAEEPRKSAVSPHSSGPFPSSAALPPMQPPSPGRARSSSMREGYSGAARDLSPGRLGPLGEPRPASAALGHERFAPDLRREEMFRSSQPPRESAHSFRAFRAPQEHSPHMNGNSILGRPSSQPVEPGPTRSLDDLSRRDESSGGRLCVFRAFGDGSYKTMKDNMPVPRQDPSPFQNGMGPTSQPLNRPTFGSPMLHHAGREQPQAPYHHQVFYGPPTREEQPGMFRPAYHPPPQTILEQARESIENRQHQDLRREYHPSSPPVSDMAQLDRYRNGFHERPLTYEEHQRMEAHGPYRKGSDGSVHRAVLNISPELNRKGRNSPLPQAVQGAQPKHIGPGGDNPGIKSEFGRMFSGLGSGVGSATPTPQQYANGTTTPSRLTPSRNMDGADASRGVAENDEARGASKSGRGGKKPRRPREETERGEAEIYDGRMTPSLSQRGNKRSKTAHHHHHHAHHHHHHHQHEHAEAQPNPFNTIRFPSNPLSHSSLITHPTHHHHHHHGAHAHQPPHHHHHPPRPMPVFKTPTTTVNSKHLIDEVADRPRKHLGSHLYEADVSFSSASLTSDPRTSFVSTMKPMPKLDGHENSTYMIRVPRWYLTRSKEEIEAGEPNRLEEICKRRQIFGTEVYSDDSDVVAAAVHSGWLKGDFGDWNDDLQEVCADEFEQASTNAVSPKNTKIKEESPLSLTSKPAKPVIPPSNYDAHITILILPTLDSYASTSQHHILSREWNKTTPHDGMSFVIHRIDFVNEGVAGRSLPRGAKARKARLAMEEVKRQEAAKALLMLPGFGGTGKSVGVGA